MGYRSIAVDNAWCVEGVPGRGYHKWRVRRAQHLVQHFAATLRYLREAPPRLRGVLIAEAHLHLFNPWILVAAAATLLYTAVEGSTIALGLIFLGFLLLAFKPYRTWIATQLYLVAASVRNLWNREITWGKQAKTG
jgi:uncharacterized membrane protein (DUF485 family)